MQLPAVSTGAWTEETVFPQVAAPAELYTSAMTGTQVTVRGRNFAINHTRVLVDGVEVSGPTIVRTLLYDPVNASLTEVWLTGGVVRHLYAAWLCTSVAVGLFDWYEFHI